MSNSPENQTPSPQESADKQPASPSMKGHYEWLNRAMEGMKRMHLDEEYRKEIAKKLS